MDFVTAAFAAECGRRLQADIYRALREGGGISVAIDLKKYLSGGDVIKPDDLQGRTVTTTIRGLDEQEFQNESGQKQAVLYGVIQGKDGNRRVKLNGASCDALQTAYGAVVEQWVGKRISMTEAGAGRYRHIAVRSA